MLDCLKKPFLGYNFKKNLCLPILSSIFSKFGIVLRLVEELVCLKTKKNLGLPTVIGLITISNTSIFFRVLALFSGMMGYKQIMYWCIIAIWNKITEVEYFLEAEKLLLWYSLRMWSVEILVLMNISGIIHNECSLMKNNFRYYHAVAWVLPGVWCVLCHNLSHPPKYIF